MAMAQNITFIPEVKTVGTQKPAEKKQKVRVAAYCRVSTESEEQESSYETQVAHYTSYINGNPEWEMVEVYADNGLSGTRTAKREAFNRMIADCEAGHIDMIITKSISHFARNTVGCLKYTRKLKELNIAVFEGGYGSAYWDEIIKRFEDAYPGVTVNMQISPKIGDIIRPQIVAGNVPDFISMNDNDSTGLISSMVKEHALMDLSDVFEEGGIDDDTPLKDQVIDGLNR